MGNGRKPILAGIYAKYRNARTIKCLEREIAINITALPEYEWNQDKQQYQTYRGGVVVWRAGVWAPIIKKKCNCGKD